MYFQPLAQLLFNIKEREIMKNIFGIGKNLSQQSQAQQEAERREREAREFDLVGTGGFLNVVKYVVFGILAALNVRLFITVVPGTWGKVIGITAVLFECFAIYAWNNQGRSAGAHQRVMVWIAVLFTGVSFVHASASFYELIGLGPSLGRPLYVYSHGIAFPLLFTLMTAGVCALYKTHWSAKVAKEQASTQVEIAKDRADLLRRTAALRSKAELSRAELAHYEEEMKTEAQFLELLRRVVTIEQEKESLLSSIGNPATRRRMAELLERDENHDGTPDILQSANMRDEAKSLMNGVDRNRLPN
jgi:hypothetical protein